MERIKEGDFVLLDFTGRKASTGEIFETTIEDEARKTGAFKEGAKYKPALVVAGKGQVPKGLDEALLTMSVGESKRIELPPDKAFGRRNPELVRVVPLSQFRKQNVEPKPGMLVELDGKRAVVKSVTSGRVMVDLNHELAGETIIYDIKILKKLNTIEEKVEGLMERNNMPKAKIEFKDGELIMTFDEKARKDADYFIGKTSLIGAVKSLIPGVKRIKVVEEYAIG